MKPTTQIRTLKDMSIYGTGMDGKKYYHEDEIIQMLKNRIENAEAEIKRLDADMTKCWEIRCIGLRMEIAGYKEILGE